VEGIGVEEGNVERARRDMKRSEGERERKGNKGVVMRGGKRDGGYGVGGRERGSV